MPKSSSSSTKGSKPSLELLVTGDLFPTEKKPHRGIFMLRQASLLRNYGVECSFLVTRPLLPWPLSKIGPWSSLRDTVAPPPNFDFEFRCATYPRPPGAWFFPYEGLAKSLPVILHGHTWNKKKKFDAVLGVDMTSGAQAAVSLGKTLKIPVATLAIGSDVMIRAQTNPLVKKEISRILNHVQLPMGVSADICDKLSRIGPADLMPLTVYLGKPKDYLDTNKNKAKLREHFGWKQNETVAIYAGRLSVEKGISELASVAKKLLLRYPKLRIVCLGNGPLLKELQKINHTISGDNSLTTPGWIDPSEVASYMAASDFLVFPSHNEGMPQVVIEAMNMGMPVIGTRIGGIPEAVIHNETGLLIDVNAPEQLEAAMIKLIEDKAFQKTAGHAGQARAAGVFNPEKNAQNMAHALYNLV